MLNNANKALGYTEVYYNYNSKLFFTDNLGSQFLELDIKTGENDNGNDGTALQPGDNVSLLTNDAGYLVSGNNVSVLANDAGYLTSYTETSDLQAITDRGSATTNDITIGRLNANHVGVPVVSSLPTTDMLFGDICALNTNNTPYFYDGTDWRALYLVGVPGQPDEPDTDWDKVILRCTFNTDFKDVKNNIDGSSSGDIVGSPSKFGGGALRIQSSESCIYDFNIDQGIDRDWMNSAFTIEAWVYFDNLADGDTVLYQKNGLQLIVRRPDSLNVFFMIKLPGQDPVSIQNNPSFFFQQWMHIAYCRNSENGLLTLFVDGNKYNNIDVMNDFNDGTSGFTVGGGVDAAADFFVDDLRVSNFERYTASYNVPTEQLPTSG